MNSERIAQAVEPLAVRIPLAAQMLGIGKSTLYEMIAAGEIETVKIGRCTLVPTDSLRSFLTRRRNSISTGEAAS
ncbi:helix-turn-helix domain-containing protein [Sphingopyxis sp. P1IMeth2]|uniref:helix-turn-helix domain-containing protein n=1 Tax=Sphingopyxis sp. P1IMeth2 TaxID=1892848 RepID=UPI001644E37E|nr:helix-turn-helix domain-containing protein [Sphingopyxis sp. P1IMeth2]